jgi:hypothetical protein
VSRSLRDAENASLSSGIQTGVPTDYAPSGADTSTSVQRLETLHEHSWQQHIGVLTKWRIRRAIVVIISQFENSFIFIFQVLGGAREA